MVYKHYQRYIVVSVLLLVFLFAFILWYATSNQNIPLTKQYSNDVFSFGISYPSSWSIYESSDRSSVSVIKNGSPSRTKPFISIALSDGSFATLRDLESIHIVSDEKNGIISTLRQENIGGLSALHGTEVFSLPDHSKLVIESHYLERNGTLYRMTLHPYNGNSQILDEMQKIVQSFHFIEK